MLFYATPILYETEYFKGAAIRFLINLNPFTHIVTAYRDLFMYHTLPSLGSLVYIAVIAVICFWGGLRIFRKLEKGFAEEI